MSLSFLLHVGEESGLAQGLAQLVQRGEALWEHMNVAERIVSFWVNTGHRQLPTWTEHEDINAVMLATALAPTGGLVLSSEVDYPCESVLIRERKLVWEESLSPVCFLTNPRSVNTM